MLQELELYLGSPIEFVIFSLTLNIFLDTRKSLGIF